MGKKIKTKYQDIPKKAKPLKFKTGATVDITNLRHYKGYSLCDTPFVEFCYGYLDPARPAPDWFYDTALETYGVRHCEICCGCGDW